MAESSQGNKPVIQEVDKESTYPAVLPQISCNHMRYDCAIFSLQADSTQALHRAAYEIQAAVCTSVRMQIPIGVLTQRIIQGKALTKHCPSLPITLSFCTNSTRVCCCARGRMHETCADLFLVPVEDLLGIVAISPPGLRLES